MLTSEELGPFTVIIPLLGVGLCFAVVYYEKNRREDNPLLAVLAVSWFIAVQLIASTDPFSSSLEWSDNMMDDLPGVMLLVAGVCIPFIGSYNLFQRSQHVRDTLVHNVPMHHMIYICSFRIAGASLLYLYYIGNFKNYALFHGGVCDTTIGLTAIPLAQYVKKRGVKNCRHLIFAWNIFGLIVGYALTFLLFMANFLGLFQAEYPLAVMLHNPISTIILFNVPLASIMHILMMANFDTMCDSHIVSNFGEQRINESSLLIPQQQ
mmetsp:Transcript_19031/g.28007  ORF Transcript_19031/g.28007 Transcript_19031/m.28007 type:complete len:265 (+) Transcript_19031:114-908(+)